MDVVDPNVTDRFVSHATAAPEDGRDAEAYKELISQCRSAMSDADVEAVDSFGSGDRVALRFSETGTPEDEFMGIEPTGREVVGDGAVIARFEDGRVADVWEYGDQLGVLSQLQVVELPAE